MTARALPFIVPPLPDEPLLSWVETMACAYRATLGEMLAAVGITTPDSPARAAAVLAGIGLTPPQRARVSAVTGVPAETLDLMTIAGIAEPVLQRDRAGRRSQGTPSLGAATRFCPECLDDANGRWRLSWQLPFAYGCARHNRLLREVCPGCRRTVRGRLGSLLDVP